MNKPQIDWGQATVDALKRHTAEEGSMLNKTMRDALRLALEAHEIHVKQKRKGKDIPYITHPLTVGFILARAGARQEIILAGILHDVLEDSVADHKVTYDVLRERFDPSVADIVRSVTEPNKELPWAERKQAALEHLMTMKGPGLWVKAADIISNVSELLDDYAREPQGEGDAIFERFNAHKADIIANYLAVMDVLIDKPLTLEGEEKTLVLDLKTLRDELYGLAQKG
jgi:(p)ppGpp synthase/HD superfamily hydrolase